MSIFINNCSINSNTGYYFNSTVDSYLSEIILNKEDYINCGILINIPFLLPDGKYILGFYIGVRVPSENVSYIFSRYGFWGVKNQQFATSGVMASN